MPPLPHSFLNEPHFKEQYASFIHEGFSPFLAALKIWPNDPPFASYIAEQWRDDAHVKELVNKHKTDKEAEKLPPKREALIKKIEVRMTNMASDDFIKAARLIAEMQGYIEKPATNVTTNLQNNVVNNPVMVVRDHGTDEQWEEKAKAQQAKLINAG